MSIRIGSPDSSQYLLSPELTRSPRWKTNTTKHARIDKVKNFLRTRSGRILLCTIIAWLTAYTYCKHQFWRDPTSWFFDENGAYDFGYSRQRQIVAKDFIETANRTSQGAGRIATHIDPVVCVGLVTVKRKQVDYLNDTIGSMLADLSEEERNVINVQVLFADPTPSRHPDFNSTWLDTVDYWSGYNVSDEHLEEIREWKKADQIQKKATFDYTYILEQCLNRTTAPYVAVFEDDLIFAEGWLPRTLSALGEIRGLSSNWLYLRLFYTEARLGWDSDIDAWYTHPLLWFCTSISIVLFTTLGTKVYWKRTHPESDISTFLVLGFVTLPLLITLIIMVGRNSLLPVRGLHRMDQKGCCTQALVYPRHQVQSLVEMLSEHEPSQTDLVIDDWADEMSYARYAISPQVAQHVGLISTRGMPKKYTRQTWAYHFEASNAKNLKHEHERLARWGIWRATDETYAEVS